MRAVRSVATALTSALVIAGAALVAPTPAAADGTTPVAVTCTGIPLLGDQQATAQVNATDDVDPVAPGGTVVNTINVPVPIEDVPIEASIKEVKLTIPIPSGVTVNNVTFSSSSFSSQTWAISGSNLVATLTGSVPLGGSSPAPTVPDVRVTTTVAGPARTVQWKVPSSITAKATWALGTINATCTPDAPGTVLISTVVAPPNAAPTATDQAVAARHAVSTPVTLAGTDPDGDTLSFGPVGSPAHGTLALVAAPNQYAYTSNVGYVGPDSFTFAVLDGKGGTDTGTVAITVANAAPTATSASLPVAYGTSTPVVLTGADTDGNALSWTVTTAPAHGTLTGTAPNLTYVPAAGYAGADAFTYSVSDGQASASATVSVTVASWWAPWSSGTAAVTDLYTWFTGTAPTASQRTAALAPLNAGTSTIGDLVASLRRGADATANVDPTTRLYAAYFVRIPDANGLNSWIGKRRAGRKLNAISASFASSSEFKTRYGKLSNRAFVELVYRNVLGREGDPAGITSWTKKLDAKTKTRGEVMVGFSESNEYKVGQVGKVDAAVVFIHLLGKAPTLTQRDAFVAAVQASSLAAAIDALRTDAALSSRAS